jgi:Fic family protein
MPDPAALGRLRTFSVGISHSTYLPIAIPQVIQECFDLVITKANSINDPFEQAFFLMVHIPYLQAFDDVNKRTSRLAANVPLIRKNLCPLSFIDVPEQMYINGLLGIYELNRVELLRDVFAWAYERSCNLYSRTTKAMGEPDPFRMKYRNSIRQVVGEIVRLKMNKNKAIQKIQQQSLELIAGVDQPRFIEIVERELLGLHEGNIARYELSSKEYEKWKKIWEAQG